MRKIRIFMLRVIRDVFFWTAKKLDGLTLTFAVRLRKHYDSGCTGKHIKVRRCRKAYIRTLRWVVKFRGIVGRCNNRIIKLRAL